MVVNSAPSEMGLWCTPAIVSICITVASACITGALGMSVLAGEGGRVTLKGDFLEEMVLESGFKAG